MKYLGNMLSYDLCDDADVSAKKCVFISAVNRLNYIFRGVPSNIKIKLLQTYCTVWYGCQTWELGTTAASSMETQWKISVRRTLGLPPRTRSILLPGLAGNLSFSHQHQRRVSQLLNTMMSSTQQMATTYMIWVQTWDALHRWFELTLSTLKCRYFEKLISTGRYMTLSLRLCPLDGCDYCGKNVHMVS